jgi:hypothetical protein
MHNRKLLLAFIALLAIGGLGVAGCGGGDGTTTTVPAAGDTAATTTTEASGGATPDDVYQACIDALAGTPAEGKAENACAQTRDAFEECMTQASNAPEGAARDAALDACQQAADQATESLSP